MKNEIQKKTLDMSIKNIFPTERKGELFLWFTLESSCSALTPRTIADVERVLRAVQEFASLSLGFEETAISEIKLWKLDYTVDLKGSFLTIPSESAQR